MGTKDSFSHRGCHHSGTRATYLKGRIFLSSLFRGVFSCGVCGWVAGSIIPYEAGWQNGEWDGMWMITRIML